MGQTGEKRFYCSHIFGWLLANSSCMVYWKENLILPESTWRGRLWCLCGCSGFLLGLGESFWQMKVTVSSPKPTPIGGPGNGAFGGRSEHSECLPGVQKEMAGVPGFCVVVLLGRVTVKIAFCKCRLQILNNFLIGHGAKAANGGKKQIFLIACFTWCLCYTCAYNEKGELV